jgi:hypothetical protein
MVVIIMMFGNQIFRIVQEIIIRIRLTSDYFLIKLPVWVAINNGIKNKFVG